MNSIMNSNAVWNLKTLDHFFGCSIETFSPPEISRSQLRRVADSLGGGGGGSLTEVLQEIESKHHTYSTVACPIIPLFLFLSDCHM